MMIYTGALLLVFALFIACLGAAIWNPEPNLRFNALCGAAACGAALISILVAPISIAAMDRIEKQG